MNCLLLDNSFIKAEEALGPFPPKKIVFLGIFPKKGIFPLFLNTGNRGFDFL